MSRHRVDRVEAGSRNHGRPSWIITAAALLLLGVWMAWWVQSVRKDCLFKGHLTWVPVLPFLAGDFTVHIDHVVRIYTAGINPYVNDGDGVCALFPYPPMILRIFSWVSLVSTPTATRIWLSALAGILALGAYGAWRTRRALCLWPMPLAVVVASLAFSTPAIYAMERGQCDPLVIPALLAAAWLLRRRNAWHQLAAGGLLGLAAWIKYYPGLAVVALLSLRPGKALMAFVAIAGLIGIVDRTDVRRAIDNGRALAAVLDVPHRIHPLQHSIVNSWKSLGFVWSSRPLRKIPGPVAAGVLLLPAVGAVSLRMARARKEDQDALVFPFLLWLAATATYALPYSNDYNLVTLPLAALCVWDRRDPVAIHVVMGLLLLWWQPIAIAVGGDVVFVIKLAALYAIGASLALKAYPAEPRVASDQEAGDASADVTLGVSYQSNRAARASG